MKNILGIALLLLIATSPVVSTAASFRSGQQVSLSTTESINENLYVAGGTITSAGAVVGDLLVAGGTIIVSGPVSADLAAAGGSMTLTAPVGGDARIVGGTIVLSSSVGGDLVVAGGTVTVGGTGIKGDTAIAGGTVSIDAPIEKDLDIRGGSVYINGPIAGSVTIDAETLTLGKSAVISGDLTYKATKEMTKEDGAVVRGKITFEPRPSRMPDAKESSAAFAAIVSAWLFGKFLMLLVSALVIGLLLRRYSTEIVTRATARPLLELGRGLLAIIALPVVSILLLVTVIGIPFGVLGIIGFFAVLIFTWMVTPIVVGSALYTYSSKKPYEVSWKTILLGVVVCSVLSLIPVFGGLAQSLLSLLTLGAMVSLKSEILKQWR